MNNFNPSKTKELQKKILDNFNTQFNYSNIFVREEVENRNKFNNHLISIPWYLKPFSKTITSIAYQSFKDGLSENCTDTVTIKRPAPYKAKK